MCGGIFLMPPPAEFKDGLSLKKSRKCFKFLNWEAGDLDSGCESL